MALTLGPMHQMTYGLLKLAPINEFEYPSDHNSIGKHRVQNLLKSQL